MKRTMFRIGFIPAGCQSEKIYCGDEDTSETQEELIYLWEDLPFRITNFWSKSVYLPTTFDFYDSDSKFWTDVIDNLLGDFVKKGSGLNATDLARAWSVYHNKNELSEDLYTLFEEAPDGSQFPKKDYYNGKFYFHFCNEILSNESEDEVVKHYNERTLIYLK